jgi:hypothetical protein
MKFWGVPPYTLNRAGGALFTQIGRPPTWGREISMKFQKFTLQRKNSEIEKVYKTSCKLVHALGSQVSGFVNKKSQ